MNHEEFLAWADDIKKEVKAKTADRDKRIAEAKSLIAKNEADIASLEEKADGIVESGDYKSFREVRDQVDFLSRQNQTMKKELVNLFYSRIESASSYVDLAKKVNKEYVALHKARAEKLHEIWEELSSLKSEEEEEISAMDLAEKLYYSEVCGGSFSDCVSIDSNDFFKNFVHGTGNALSVLPSNDDYFEEEPYFDKLIRDEKKIGERRMREYEKLHGKRITFDMALESGVEGVFFKD